MEIYRREKVEFYQKALPVLSAMIVLLTLTLEFYYRALLTDGDLSAYISIVNGVASLLFLIMTFLHKKFPIVHSFICPGLTLLLFLYLSFVDYDYTLGSIYYSMIIGFTFAYFVLVVFNERWLISTMAFAPGLTLYMYKTGIDLLGEEWQELIMRCVFCTLIYALIAYKVESLAKQSFMGRESSEKAFHRWMKIFETFPEGIALIRGGYVLYANKALKFILNIGIERTYEDDPIYELLKGDLKNSVVEQWVKSQSDLKKMGQDKPKVMSVWQFLINNEKGAIF